MTRDVAIRIDGMVLGILGQWNHVAHYMKNNIGPEDYARLVQIVGKGMGEAVGLSNELHALFPDIVPDEIGPETRVSHA